MIADRFFRDRDGCVVLAQWPNPALIAWLVLLIAAKVWASHADVLRAAGAGALIAWAADEALRGVNPFRRLLGAVVLASQVVALVHRQT
ncbi:MAG TPA: hypothetical protein VGN35_03085 [Jatrophihabitantaceae bacterium]|nr:hypothetical protein [Jatrophihabitantaceae bacterium]